ncbi:hypothetical protein BDA99DRAFT_446548 [Phascolomyces articulosus]|uniref:RNB domain-containing protein n=1 Tax=Phascolomyces articulosus TaxID=60185 RepID=A0AAD5JZE8_9FUNG|nr:hypothetical protein BDA99DRAFT_446548 [Phascolomyces articulosus]
MYPVFFGKPSPDHYQQYNDDSSTTTAKRLNGNKWWNDNTFHGFSYPPYLSAKEIEIQSNSGELHIGTLRISRYRRYDAYVSASSLDDDIYVGSELCRNRAFDGDVVAIQLMDVDTVWKQRKEAAQRYLARNGFNTDSPEDEEDAVDLGDAEDEEETGEMLGYKPKYVGKVVGIVERPRERIVVGVLTLSRISESNASSTNELHKVWFRPLDKRTPLFYIPVGNGPTDILQNEDYYKSHLYVAKMLAWQPHKVRPVGKIIRELGQIGDMSVETNAILTDCCIATKPYSEMALATIPPLPFTIPEAEFDKRSDMREIATFTIDPSTAKDLDDALHIKRFMDTFEVGVHIADVSYFVRPNTPLDSEAKERGTSTYLVDNVLPMLPETLCQDLCSLKAGEDRLAFSVIWRMDKEANVIDTSFFKTIIRSNAQLSYEDAQNVLEGGHLDPSIPRATEIEQSIHDLMELAGHLRRRRFKAGALAIDTLKLEYKLEGGEPISVSSYQRMDAHGLIEEFMLQANLSTAKKISKHYPNEALLRRHRHPIIRRMNEFVELAQDLGFEIDAETAGSLQKSFDNIPGGEIKQALFALAIRPMQRAKYFCAGTMDPTEWLHYALNEKSYTHFTSPIRRYADITIHRQLEYAMNSKKMSGYNKASVQSIAFHCNYRKELAGRAQELNNHLYLCRYLSQKATQPAIVSATVIVVELDFIEVYQHTYGLKRRLYVEDLPLTQNEFDSDQNTVTWYWKQGVMVDMESHMRRMHRLPISKHQRNHVDEEALSNTNSSSNAKTKTTTIKKRVDTKLRAPPKQLIPSLLDKEACTQTFSVFSTLNIRLQVNSARSPPVINAYPINPFY